MEVNENDLGIYYEFRNPNTSRQETEISAIIKRRNSHRLKLVSSTKAAVYS